MFRLAVSVKILEGVLDERRREDIVVGEVRCRQLVVVPQDIRAGIEETVQGRLLTLSH